MGKSMDMKAEGLTFDEFMRALVRVPKEAINKAMEKKPKKRQRRRRKSA